MSGHATNPNGGIFEILEAAESGNLQEFQRLYLEDPSRLSLQDGRGRTAAHQATLKNNINILNCINNYGGDLNARDSLGNTPLHIAVDNDALEAIKFLLQKNVDTSLLNEKNQAPIHLAAEANKISILQIFVEYKHNFDVNLGGEHGRTALHFAAIHDHDECAKMLITDLDANLKLPCNNGYYPIHEAAKNASSRTMEVFLQWGESMGYTRESMMSVYDHDGNVPLHSAVHGGDVKAVELCLEFGAKISTQQHDLSTPVHLACAQGALDIVMLMFSKQPSEKMACLNSYDAQKMTPIHCAAMFDNPEVVDYLVSEGSDVNPLDKEKRSPLLLAAFRTAWKTVDTLIRLGADMSLKDINSRNVLHLLVMQGGRVADFANSCKIHCASSLNTLLNEKDNAGYTALHYASHGGHIRSVEALISLGAMVNSKNLDKESPLHIAARYGRYQTICRLLESKKGTFIMNESNGAGLTPLHIACREGHLKVIKLLLHKGAILQRDHSGRTPLHMAAMGGHIETIELLHSVHSHLLDQVDRDGNTPLHLATLEDKPNAVALLLSMNCRLTFNNQDRSAIDYAINFKFPRVALVMVTHEERAKEVMMMRSEHQPCVTMALIAHMPKVFEAVLDKCITKADCRKDSESFFIKYNFEFLCAQTNEEERAEGEIPKKVPLVALNAMVTHGRVQLLSHPLSQKYLQMKWNSYGKYFHAINLLFHILFLGLVMMYTYQLMTVDNTMGNKIIRGRGTTATFADHLLYQTNYSENQEPSSSDSDFESRVVMYTCALCILVYNGVCLVREAYNLREHKWRYLMDATNLVSWLTYISSTITVLPSLYTVYTDAQFSAAAIAVFLTWFQLLLLLQWFETVGIYIVMFLEILQTLMKVLTVFSILIIAFGLAFYILLSKGNHLSFNNIPVSLMRIFAMMLGELDFVGTYVQPLYKDSSEITLPFPMATFAILFMFMILMSTLLVNLMIGLAVGDIESVRRNAQLKRLAMQVVLHTELERKLPDCLLDKVDKTELIDYPNNRTHKLGFFDTILTNWFCYPFKTNGETMDIDLDSSENLIATELETQKNRIHDITEQIAEQNVLIKLLVKKLDIKTEEDDRDEGMYPKSSSLTPQWNSTMTCKKLRAANKSA